MTTINFKTVIIIVLSIILVIFSASFLKNERNTNNLTTSILEDSQVKNLQEDEKKWNIYTDERYKYSLKFPSGLNIYLVYEREIKVAESIGGGSFIVNGGVSFNDPDFDNYGVMAVSVFENVKFSNTDEWLKKESNKFKSHRPVIEKRIIIDGYDAIITYVQSDYERKDAYKHEKITVFLKNDNLFKIWTRFNDISDHEKVWDSFRFD